MSKNIINALLFLYYWKRSRTVDWEENLTNMFHYSGNYLPRNTELSVDACRVDCHIFFFFFLIDKGSFASGFVLLLQFENTRKRNFGHLVWSLTDVKFVFFEKATKIWKKSLACFDKSADLLSKCQSKRMIFFQILWPFYNFLTLIKQAWDILKIKKHTQDFESHNVTKKVHILAYWLKYEWNSSHWV